MLWAASGCILSKLFFFVDGMTFIVVPSKAVQNVNMFVKVFT